VLSVRALVVIMWSAGTYALLGLGIVLIYRTSRVLNFAQGELAIMLGYVCATLLAFGVPPSAAVPGILLLSALSGLLIYALIIRHVIARPPVVAILITVGLAIALRALMVVFYEGRTARLNFGVVGGMTIAGERVSQVDLLSIVGTWGLVLLVYTLYMRSKIGMNMRAVAEHPTLAAQRGVNVDFVVGSAWVVALSGAAASGLFYGASSLLSTSAPVIGVKATIAALIGGLDSPRGVVLGSLVVAVAEYLTVRLLAVQYLDLMPVVILLVILVFRPWGLFGTVEQVERV
jgi:branched-chain amino acid transport system permease protein